MSFSSWLVQCPLRSEGQGTWSQVPLWCHLRGRKPWSLWLCWPFHWPPLSYLGQDFSLLKTLLLPFFLDNPSTGCSMFSGHLPHWSLVTKLQVGKPLEPHVFCYYFSIFRIPQMVENTLFPHLCELHLCPYLQALHLDTSWQTSNF